MKVNRWTRKELSILKENYQKSPTDELLSLLPSRNLNAIEHKAHRIGIKRRGIYTRPQKPHHRISKDWLIEYYINKEYSMQQCGDLLSVSPTTILKAIKLYEIPVRKATDKAHEAAKEKIKQGNWAILKIDHSGDKNPAKQPAAREKIRLSKLGPKNAMYGKRGCAHPLYGRRGPNATNWRGGISFEPYCFKFNKEFKEHIRNKFNRKCYICQTPENGRKHHVHHIDYNKNSICNGKEWAFVPLCIKHHTRSNYNRWHWFNLLINYWAMNSEINFMYPNTGHYIGGAV